ncbi:MAG TPA: hypothetical protein H9891_04330 [Candidatus Salinicoccus stercoripullorum]|uniref:Uncharacterized protein n=1 Tax=Candidatus Salinicoccus stercoripullorum TaxID=2838756 RepID=A0A9D1QFT7_9STAP|nr:hypothetical protein [Candidatus Salinicoccus stercoripullorum]
MSDITLNESGATLELVFAFGLIFMPKANKAMTGYVLPTLALPVLITTSGTAMAAAWKRPPNYIKRDTQTTY